MKIAGNHVMIRSKLELKVGMEMLFTIDVGNTNIVIGVFNDDVLVQHWRMQTDRHKTADEYGMTIRDLLEHAGLHFDSFEAILISSVVPPIMPTLESLCVRYFHMKPLVVGQGVKTGLVVDVDSPDEVGADRIVNAVAGIKEYGAPLILIDFGTATTFCAIDASSTYVGGAISPGIAVATEALYKKAAKLPYIELALPDHVIGKNTIHSMQSGILYGYVGLVEGIVKRMSEQFPIRPRVVATGGLAPIIASETPVIDLVDPLLTLKGLQVIYQVNARALSENK